LEIDRLDQIAADIQNLQKKIDVVRNDLAQDIDEKFRAITEILERVFKEIKHKKVSFGDSSALFRHKLGERCWRWLGSDTRSIFVSAEGLYQYFMSVPEVDTIDFSPSLLQFCRGLELLLNTKLARLRGEIQGRVEKNGWLQEIALSHIRGKEAKKEFTRALRKEKYFSIGDTANLLRGAAVIQKDKGGRFSRGVEELLRASPGLGDLDILEPLAQVGTFFRNGKSHPQPDDRHSLFTSREETELLRKLLFGIDEYSIDGTTLCSRVEDSPRLSAAEGQETGAKLSVAWEKYPGLVKKLWQALESHAER